MNEPSHAQSGEQSDRRARFFRVAERRTREILHKLRLLGNCSNKSAYSYTEEEVEHIFSAIQEQLDSAHARFEPSKREVDFRLK